jgi:ATP-dependent DNA helicase RecQ
VDRQVLVDRFDGERKDFVNAILTHSKQAKTWWTVDIDAIVSHYKSDRARIVTALEYFDEQNLIELQAKQMTEVYEVNARIADPTTLTAQLQMLFEQKQQAEINRIEQMLALFQSDQCLSVQLAHYYGDMSLNEPCGHCSVCYGRVAQLPEMLQLKPLAEFRFNQLCDEILDLLTEDKQTATVLTRYLCGITNPILTKVKARATGGFAKLEHYRYRDVYEWVTQHL